MKNMEFDKTALQGCDGFVVLDPKVPRCHYDLFLTDEDLIRAKTIFDKGNSPMYMDPLRLEVVEKYLSHFPGTKYNLQEILTFEKMVSVLETDKELAAMAGPLRTIPESFDEVCAYLGSVSRSEA